MRRCAADCLAEGRKWLDKNAAEAAASRKEDPQFFKDGGWDFERKYAIRSVVADRYVSVLRNDYMDTHGAHPNSDVNTILWDKSREQAHLDPPVLHRDRRQRGNHEGDGEGRDRFAGESRRRSATPARPRPTSGSRASSRACSRSAR